MAPSPPLVAAHVPSQSVLAAVPNDLTCEMLVHVFAHVHQYTHVCEDTYACVCLQARQQQQQPC
jgi:hypothetical protein